MISAIKSNRVVTPEGVRKAFVLVQGRKIIDVLNDEPGGEVNVTDVGDNVLMPGIVDPHVHINEPGRTEWEGFDTATKAALAGGITTLVEMPLNASPVTTTVKAFLEKQHAATGKIHVDCGFWGGVVPGNEKEIEKLIGEGPPGFKAFLTHSGIEDFPAVTENDLRKAMTVLARYQYPLLVHCELTDNRRIGETINGRVYKNYLDSRPRKWEDDAIALMILLCEDYETPVHIVHLSSADSIRQIAEAKQRGLPLTVETAQHYLYFNAEDIPDGQTAFKCAPPIREKENNERLWQALKDGIIDFVATDHSPAPPSMKETESGDFMKAWGGISSLQFSLPALWTAGKRHNCRLEDMAKWLCERPALLSFFEVKGKIEKGFDADFVVWNPEEKIIVTEDIIQHRHKLTPYVGETLYGVVKQTWLGGEKVYEGGKFLHLNKGRILYG